MYARLHIYSVYRRFIGKTVGLLGYCLFSTTDSSLLGYSQVKGENDVNALRLISTQVNLLMVYACWFTGILVESAVTFYIQLHTMWKHMEQWHRCDSFGQRHWVHKDLKVSRAETDRLVWQLTFMRHRRTGCCLSSIVMVCCSVDGASGSSNRPADGRCELE